ncbi:MAG: lipoyl(octanoyl) transferase [Gammaproteobacteria bacterium]
MTIGRRMLGLRPYRTVLQAMQSHTRSRFHGTGDELWIVEHPAVYTLGQAGSVQHILGVPSVDVVHSDRGGQVTYHGPGQVILYVLLELRPLGLSVRQLVSVLEQTAIDFLGHCGLCGERRPGAPGVYVGGRKIAALGLRVSRGCSYHGLSFNVDMDLTPFEGIDPCGYSDLEVTQLRALGVGVSVVEVGRWLSSRCAELIGTALNDVQEPSTSDGVESHTMIHRTYTPADPGTPS